MMKEASVRHRMFQGSNSAHLFIVAFGKAEMIVYVALCSCRRLKFTCSEKIHS